MNLFVALLYGVHDQLPFAFYIGSVCVELRVESGVAKDSFAYGDIFRHGNADTDRHDAYIGDCFHCDRYLLDSIVAAAARETIQRPWAACSTRSTHTQPSTFSLT